MLTYYTVYQCLCDKLHRGRLTPRQFNNYVDKCRIVFDSGTNYKIKKFYIKVQAL